MTPPPKTRLPHLAVLLMNLFTAAEDADSIVGDLAEEFGAIADQVGTNAARKWFWRQTFGTILRLIVARFCAAPFSMLVIVLAGFWLIGFVTSTSAQIIRGWLDSNGLYESHPHLYLTFLRFPLHTGRLIICSAIGCLVASAARRREMMAVTALAALQIILFFTSAVVQIANGREWMQWFFAMLPWNVLSALAVMTGGAVVRMKRSPRTGQLTT